jgi:transcriptional regulator with GAF, ATPase, and Fis domain
MARLSIFEKAQMRSGQCVPEPMNGGSGRERQIIQVALAESGGRIYGANGAAAKLQMPPSTLDYRIKKLQISKGRFKFC